MLENELTTVAQSRKLYELGFRKEAEFVWVKTYKYTTPVDKNGDMKKEDITILQQSNEFITQNHNPMGAYLLSEIITELPKELKDDEQSYEYLNLYTLHGSWFITYEGYEKQSMMEFEANNPIEAACDLLIWCIENGFISVSKDD